MQQDTLCLREGWLDAAVAFLVEHMMGKGLASVSVRVSCGWPSRRGVGQKRYVIGQCFAPTHCQDGRPQIFISPRIADSVEVLATLLHELVHASVGVEQGHGKAFSQAAKLVGLDGPPTATVASDALRSLLRAYIERVGPYPHATIQLQWKERAGSRLRLYECACEPPIKVRVASDTFAARCLRCDARFSLVEKQRS